MNLHTFDFTDFWLFPDKASLDTWYQSCQAPDAYSKFLYEQRILAFTPPSQADIDRAEQILGYRLPDTYKQLLLLHNGGQIQRDLFPIPFPSSLEQEYVGVSSIMGIGGDGDIVEETKQMIEEWEYPPIGVVVCDCPSAGHDIIMLDYRTCGPLGEPRVVHVDQEWDYHITPLAKDFATFLQGLQTEEYKDETGKGEA